MDESALLYFIGAITLLVGLVMIGFRQVVGVAFCRMGRWIWAPFEDVPGLDAMIERVYDEQRAPRIFLMLGIVNVAQSPIFFVLGYLLA